MPNYNTDLLDYPTNQINSTDNTLSEQSISRLKKVTKDSIREEGLSQEHYIETIDDNGNTFRYLSKMAIEKLTYGQMSRNQLQYLIRKGNVFKEYGAPIPTLIEITNSFNQSMYLIQLEAFIDYIENRAETDAKLKESKDKELAEKNKLIFKKLGLKVK